MIKNNEKGSTLVMVLLIVVVITILGAALFTMNMSASKQFTKKEHQVQARHLAEMGVVHYHAMVKEEVDTFNSEYEPTVTRGEKESYDSYLDRLKKEYNNRLCGTIKEEIDKTLKYTVQDMQGNVKKQIYEVTQKDVNGCTSDGSSPQIIIDIDSEGTSEETPSLIAAKVDVMPLKNEGETDPDEESDSKPGSDEHDREPGSNSDATNGKTEWDLWKILAISNRCDLSAERKVENSEECMSELPIAHLTNVDWIFKDNFVRNGSLELGSVSGGNSKVLIEKDFILRDSLKVGATSSVQIIIKGNFITLDQTSIFIHDNTREVVVCGDAIFDKKPDLVSDNKLLVQGDVYEDRGLIPLKDKYKPNSSQDFDFADYCPLSSQPDPEDPNPSNPDDYKWQVNPDVTPDYFPERNKNS